MGDALMRANPFPSGACAACFGGCIHNRGLVGRSGPELLRKDRVVYDKWRVQQPAARFTGKLARRRVSKYVPYIQVSSQKGVRARSKLHRRNGVTASIEKIDVSGYMRIG